MRKLVCVAIVVTLGAVAVSGLRCRRITVPESARTASYETDPWRQTLKACVRDGLVDYAALRRDHADQLDRYLDVVARYGPLATPELFPERAHRLAFHLNAYNAIMLRRWLDAGAGSDGRPRRVNRLWFVFDKWRVDGRWVTLDQLEQSIIRPTYTEPRVHFALVCGASSCPPLLAEPFAAHTLDEQLDQLGRRWLGEPDAMQVKTDALWLSSIFKWYGEDFESMGGLSGVIERFLASDDPRREAVLEQVRAGRIHFMPYDWTINDVEALPEG